MPLIDQPLSTAIIDQKFELISYQLKSNVIEKNSLLSMTFVWHAIEDIRRHYRMISYLKQRDQLIDSHVREIGYKIYPTFFWKKGEVVKEQYSLYLPNLKPGHYSLKVSFVDLDSQIVSISTKSDPNKDSNIILLKEFDIHEK